MTACWTIFNLWAKDERMNRREFVKDMALAGLLMNVAPKLFPA